MNDELEKLWDITRRLEAAGMVYMLAGSTALNYYVQSRLTRDIGLAAF